MKLSCDSLDLSDALSEVGKALPIKKVMPILNGIKLKAEGDTLTLTATDLELSIEKKIHADILIEGETVIAGKYFTDYIRKIEGEEVIIDTTEENRLKLTYGENNGYIQTMEADEYPAFKNVDDENSFLIVKKELKNLIEKIIFCTAFDAYAYASISIFIPAELREIIFSTFASTVSSQRSSIFSIKTFLRAYL